MSDSDKQIERVIAESDVPADATQEQPLQPDLKPDRTRQFTNTNFSRMRTTWRDDQQPMMAVIQGEADRIIRTEFRVAFAVLDRIHKHVRIPMVNGPTGEVLTHADGSVRWKLDEYGVPEEEWELLTGDEKLCTGMLWTINTWLAEWELVAVKKWAEAMFAKVEWEQAFARGYKTLPGEQITGKPTIDDRTQTGHRVSADERYFAVFQSVLSRSADRVVESMTRIQWLLQKTVDRR
jgi:hypothetical protein